MHKMDGNNEFSGEKRMIFEVGKSGEASSERFNFDKNEELRAKPTLEDSGKFNFDKAEELLAKPTLEDMDAADDLVEKGPGKTLEEYQEDVKLAEKAMSGMRKISRIKRFANVKMLIESFSILRMGVIWQYSRLPDEYQKKLDDSYKEEGGLFGEVAHMEEKFLSHLKPRHRKDYGETLLKELGELTFLSDETLDKVFDNISLEVIKKIDPLSSDLPDNMKSKLFLKKVEADPEILKNELMSPDLSNSLNVLILKKQLELAPDVIASFDTMASDLSLYVINEVLMAQVNAGLNPDPLEALDSINDTAVEYVEGRFDRYPDQFSSYEEYTEALMLSHWLAKTMIEDLDRKEDKSPEELAEMEDLKKQLNPKGKNAQELLRVLNNSLEATYMLKVLEEEESPEAYLVRRVREVIPVDEEKYGEVFAKLSKEQ